MAEDVWAQFPDAPKAPTAQNNDDPWAEFPDAKPEGDTQSETESGAGQFVKDLGRAAAMQAGSFAKGAMSLVSLPADLATMLYNMGAAKTAPYEVTIDGKKEQRQAGNLPTPSKAFADAVDSVVPEPRNTTERVANRVVEALGGAATGIGTGRAIGGAVGEMLAAAPGGQAVAGGAGATASQLTAEAGGGPIAQTVAGLVGAVAPGVSRMGLAEGVKRSFRGGEVGRARTAENIQAFEDAGTTPSVGQATQTRRAQAAESLLSKTPGGAGRMADKATQQATDIGAGIEETASKLAPKSSAEQAGREIKKGISGEGGFVEQFKAKQEQLYDELDQFIAQDTPTDISNTRGALKSLNATIPGAPNVSKFFQNSKIKGIEDALEKDLAIPGEPQKALDKALQKIDELYRSRDYAMQDSGRFQAYSQTQGNKTHNFVPVPGMPRFPGRYSPFPDNQAAGAAAAAEAKGIAKSRADQARELEASIVDLQNAVEASGGKLPYQAIKQLRTLVGREMSDSGLMSDVPRSKWKALYGALSSDLENAAKTAGPKATQAYTRANNYTRAGMRRLETLDAVIDKNGGPEAIFKAATGGTKEGATTLRAVMQSLPEDGQKMVAATVLRRLGRSKPGQQDDIGEAFSSETFLTNWNSMSPEAKKVLFNRFGPSFRQDMDTVAKVAANLRQGSKVFQNPSGTGQAVQQATAAATFLTAIFTGNTGVAAGVAAGVSGANLSARLLTHPPFVKWLAKTTGKPKAAIPASLNALALQGKSDPLMAEAYSYLSEEARQQKDQNDQRSQPE